MFRCFLAIGSTVIVGCDDADPTLEGESAEEPAELVPSDLGQYEDRAERSQ